MLRRAAACAALALVLAGSPGRARADAPPVKPPAVELIQIERKRQGLMEEARYEEAIPLVQRLIALREQISGADHLDTLQYVLWLAALHRYVGDWAAAEQLYERVIATLERTRRSGHVDRKLALRGLVQLYREKGDLERALPLAQGLVRAQEEAHGPEDTSLVELLRDLAQVHQAMGAFAAAEALLRRALTIVEQHGLPATTAERTLLDDNGYVVSAVAWESRIRDGEVAIASALARLLLEAGEPGRAQAFAARAAASAEEVAAGLETLQLAYALHDLGRALAGNGDAAGALSVYTRSLVMRERLRGPQHSEVATALHSLALLHNARGESAEAEALGRRALPIVERAFGAEHRRVADVLFDITLALVAQRRLGEAMAPGDRACALREREAQVMLAVGSDAQKRELSVGLRKHSDAMVSLAALHGAGYRPLARLALRSLLRAKGRLIDAEANELSVLRGRLDQQDQALFDDLERATAALAAAAARGATAASEGAARERLGRLAAERERLAAVIAERSGELRADVGLLTVEEIAAALPDDAALVEITEYRPFLLPRAGAPVPATATAVPWGEMRYAAFVLRRGEVAVEDLGPVSAVDAAASRLRSELANPDLTRDPRPAAREAYARIFAPIATHVREARHLLWSPDGALQLVPLAALVDEAGRYLVESHLITYLGSGRDLLRFQAHAAARQGPLMLGAPDFGALPGRPAAQGARRAAESIDMGRIGFMPLPDTAKEAEAVHSALGKGVVLTGELATESVVKRASAPAVLHIATHGFFLPGKVEAEARAGGLEVTGAETAAALALESPLVRSGIALAGANLRASGSDDGILTALEAATLDLAGTELVVLSACETGLGAAVRGDGVHGLRRAFAIAGAETLMMSLWQVDSGRTRELMASYYRALGAGIGRSEGLRRAQLAMLAAKPTAHPNLWASFIVSGAWAPLRSLPPIAPPKVEPAHACGCTAAGEDATAGRAALLAAALLAAAALRARLSPRRHTRRAI